MTKKELETKVTEYRELSALAEETKEALEAVKHEIIGYMSENDLTEEFTSNAKITFKEQDRKTLDKKRLEEDLGDLSDYTKVSTYNVLRIK